MRLSIEVGADATLAFGTSAPGKVYRARDGLQSRWTLDATVADGALLALVPEPLTCFAGADYRQAHEISLTRGASLLFVDVLSAGRTARGERWAFERCATRLRVRLDERLVLHDALNLEAGALPVASRLERFDALATMLLCGPRLAAHAGPMLEAIAHRPTRGEPLVASASPFRDGVLIRAAADEVARLVAFTRTLLEPLLRELDDGWHAPW